MDLTHHKLPYITKDIEGFGGRIKEKPENFVVEEIPAYQPEGEGEHLFIHLTKTGITTKEVHKRLARLFNVPPKNVNYAGIKDKNAVASQYYSVWLNNKEDKDIAFKLEDELPVKINSLGFHKRKIKQGHLKGNAFNIIITGLEYPVEEAVMKTREIVEIIHRKGLPNFYGHQRFGIEQDNALKGYELIKGENKIKNKWLRKFLLSAYQSYLFNYYLVKRMNKGLYEKMLTGDVAKKHDTGGIFVAEDAEQEQKRLENKEICYTGPMYGKKMKPASGESGRLEEDVLSDNQITGEEIQHAGLTGTRRQGIIVPHIEYEGEENGVRLRFTLPKGAYATIVLREFMKNEH
jgi:tRNA pseudouridine13 synthase